MLSFSRPERQRWECSQDGWEGLREDQKVEKLFEWLRAGNYTRVWGYRDYAHMRNAKNIRPQLTAARSHQLDLSIYERSRDVARDQ